jgi:hypothetical protein
MNHERQHADRERVDRVQRRELGQARPRRERQNRLEDDES